MVILSNNRLQIDQSLFVKTYYTSLSQICNSSPGVFKVAYLKIKEY